MSSYLVIDTVHHLFRLVSHLLDLIIAQYYDTVFVVVVVILLLFLLFLGMAGKDWTGSVLTDCAVGGLPLNETTLAEALKAASYNTAMLGKWCVCLN